MRATVRIDQIQVDKDLYDFVNNEAIPGSGVQAAEFWKGFGELVRSLAPRNAAQPDGAYRSARTGTRLCAPWRGCDAGAGA